MSAFSPTSRQRQILKSLSTTTVMSVNALSRLTDVSGVTIRRDLAELAHEGLVTRVHGGALRAPRRGASQPISLRRSEDLEAKRVLARATAALVDDGESVIIDNGTTCEMVAENLVGRDIRALCLSLSAAATLASTPGPVVTVPGGIVETDTLAMLTTTAVDAVRRFRAKRPDLHRGSRRRPQGGHHWFVISVSHARSATQTDAFLHLRLRRAEQPGHPADNDRHRPGNTDRLAGGRCVRRGARRVETM